MWHFAINRRNGNNTNYLRYLCLFTYYVQYFYIEIKRTFYIARLKIIADCNTV